MAKEKLHIELDFETFSEADISWGAWRYAEDESTEILCFAWAEDHGEPNPWTPGKPCPWWIEQRVWETTDFRLEAHNAEFEKAIYRRVCVERYGWPDIPDRYWYCSAAKAAAHSLPRDLKRAGAAMNCDKLKDDEGRRVMLKLTQPKRPSQKDPSTRWTPKNAFEDFLTLYAYNGDDILAEASLSKKLRDLNPTERKVWLLDQKINERGVRLDVEAIKGALSIIKQYEVVCRKEIYALTEGQLHGVSQLTVMKDWMRERGVDIPDLSKNTVAEFLEKELPSEVKTLLEYRQSLSRSSTKKFTSMLNSLCRDGRVRSLLMYHGAGTGRWSGKNIQIQNFPRRKVKDHEKVIDNVRKGNMNLLRMLYGDVMDLLSACLRGMIIASEGHTLFVADYAAIEARGLAWLSGQNDVIYAFEQNDKGTGDEPYCIMASQIYGFRVFKDKHEEERQVGKVAILALGYQGGINAFATMAAVYKIDLDRMADALWPTISQEEFGKAEFVYKGYLKTKQKAEEEPLPKRAAIACDVVKQRWREANENSVNMWHEQERAAKQATKEPGKVIKAGRLSWALIDGFLYCKLPSGRCLAYRDPKIVSVRTNFDTDKDVLTYMDVDATTKQWIRQKTYGGKLVENITQAVCRDIMAEAMLRVDEDGFKVLFTVHDEVVSEALVGEKNVGRYIELLEERPKWGEGFPIRAEGWSDFRYRK